MIVQKGKTVYTGRAPKGLLDLKAAVRYLRFFDRDMLGDAEHIITDGTSAGGAMSSLLGSTGNNPSYEPMLKAMGAADTRDDVFALSSILTMRIWRMSGCMEVWMKRFDL